MARRVVYCFAWLLRVLLRLRLPRMHRSCLFWTKRKEHQWLNTWLPILYWAFRHHHALAFDDSETNAFVARKNGLLAMFCFSSQCGRKVAFLVLNPFIDSFQSIMMNLFNHCIWNVFLSTTSQPLTVLLSLCRLHRTASAPPHGLGTRSAEAMRQRKDKRQAVLKRWNMQYLQEKAPIHKGTCFKSFKSIERNNVVIVTWHGASLSANSQHYIIVNGLGKTKNEISIVAALRKVVVATAATQPKDSTMLNTEDTPEV